MCSQMVGGRIRSDDNPLIKFPGCQEDIVDKFHQQTMEKLAQDYLAHAEYEERYFLPLSAKIIKKD